MNKDYDIAIYAMAVVGTLLGFMCFNYHPARIFMGDTGSLALGGFLAALAVLTRQELLFILIGGVFLIETLSVIIFVFIFILLFFMDIFWYVREIFMRFHGGRFQDQRAWERAVLERLIAWSKKMPVVIIKNYAK